MQRGEPKAIKQDAASRASLIYTAQRLAELTNYYSLDSYKTPAVNVPVLIKEAIAQIDSIHDAEQGISSTSSEPILAELRQRLSGNIIIKRMIPHERHISLYDMFEKNNNLHRLKVIAREISSRSYTTEAMNLLIDAVSAENKRDIEYICKELASSLENMGMSKEHLYNSIIDFFFMSAPHISEPDCLRRLFREIFPHHHTFNLCFKTGKLVDTLEADHFSAFSMEVADALPEKFQNAAIKTPFQTAGDGEKYIIVSNIQAFDRFSAIRAAQKKAGLLQNLFRMYHHKQSFNLSETVLVEQCCLDTIIHMPCKMIGIQSVTDDRPKKAARKLDTLLRETNFIRGSDYNKFVSVVEFHGMSLDALSVENQLLNLWISLETVAPSKKGCSKIESVIRATLPVVGLNYIRRLCERAAFDLLAWDHGATRSVLNAASPGTNLSWADKVVRLCSLPENIKNLEDLFAQLGDNELLRHRLYNFHSLLSKPNKLLQFIKSHNDRVEWQIKRIYRARNSIVHNGSTPSFLESIVQNAHDYFDQVLHATVDVSCGPSGFNTYAACFDFFEWEYDTYLDRIKNMEAVSLENVNNYVWKSMRRISREDVLQPPKPKAA